MKSIYNKLRRYRIRVPPLQACNTKSCKINSTPPKFNIARGNGWLEAMPNFGGGMHSERSVDSHAGKSGSLNFLLGTWCSWLWRRRFWVSRSIHRFPAGMSHQHCLNSKLLLLEFAGGLNTSTQEDPKNKKTEELLRFLRFCFVHCFETGFKLQYILHHETY